MLPELIENQVDASPNLQGAPFSRSICRLATPHNKPRSPPFRNVIFAKFLGNALALLYQLSGVKMINDFYRRIISDGRRRDKEGVSLSLGSSDTRVRHAGDELVDSGGARAAGRFSSNGDPKNSPGAKPFSHGRFHTRDAGARIGSLGETLQSMGRNAPQDLIVTVHG
jgi:hypothetical protein